MDCASLDAPGSYTFTSSNNKTTFALHCAQDIYGYDVLEPSMGIWTATIRDCLQLCATTNNYDCAGVSYHLEGIAAQSCYMKIAAVM